jgi:hypothetical protein
VPRLLRGFCSLGRSGPRSVFSLRDFRLLICFSREALARFVVPAQAPVSAPKDRSRPSCLAFFPLLRLFPLGFFTHDLLRLWSVVAASFRVPWLVEQLPKIFFLRKQLSAVCLCFSDSICRLRFPRCSSPSFISHSWSNTVAISCAVRSHFLSWQLCSP